MAGVAMSDVITKGAAAIITAASTSVADEEEDEEYFFLLYYHLFYLPRRKAKEISVFVRQLSKTNVI
jgi:hypothetical protein